MTVETNTFAATRGALQTYAEAGGLEVRLFGDDYIHDDDAAVLGDIAAAELTGGTYAATALTGETWDTSGDIPGLAADDVTITGVDDTVGAYVVCKVSTGAVIADGTFPGVVTSGSFPIIWTDGLIATVADDDATLDALDVRVTALEDAPGGTAAAEDVTYDNGTSDLVADDVQAALDELAATAGATGAVGVGDPIDLTAETWPITADLTGSVNGAELVLLPAVSGVALDDVVTVTLPDASVNARRVVRFTCDDGSGDLGDVTFGGDINSTTMDPFGVLSAGSVGSADIDCFVHESDGASWRGEWKPTTFSGGGGGFTGSDLHALTGKTTPVDADETVISDSAASNAAKKVTFTNLWANYLKAKADALYDATGAAAAVTTTSIGAVPTARALAGLDLSADRSASALRTALALVPGTDVQAYDPDLAAVAALTTDSFGLALLTKTSSSAVRTYLGLVIGTDVLSPSGSGASLTGIPESAVTNLTTDLAAKAAQTDIDTAVANAVVLNLILGS